MNDFCLGSRVTGHQGLIFTKTLVAGSQIDLDTFFKRGERCEADQLPFYQKHEQYQQTGETGCYHSGLLIFTGFKGCRHDVSVVHTKIEFGQELKKSGFSTMVTNVAKPV